MVLKREGARGALRLAPEEPPAAESCREQGGGPGILPRRAPRRRACGQGLSSEPARRRTRRLSRGERARVLRTCWRLQLLRGRPGRPGPRFWRASLSPSCWTPLRRRSLPPGLAHVHAGGAEPLFCPLIVSPAAGHRAERPPPRADLLPGRPKLPEKGGGGWQPGGEKAPAEVSVKPGGRRGGVPHAVSSYLKFEDLGSCLLLKEQRASVLEISLLPSPITKCKSCTCFVANSTPCSNRLKFLLPAHHLPCPRESILTPLSI